MEPVCEEFMVNVVMRLLQGDNVPLSCNLFFNRAFFSTSRTWILVVFAQPLLNGRAVGHVGIKEYSWVVDSCLRTTASRYAATAF